MRFHLKLQKEGKVYFIKLIIKKGDPDKLIASSEKAEKVLNWKRKYDSIEKIVESAWKWHKNNKNGFLELKNE
jgi:UDP-glucose 4-epimerase